ncbi:MAG TPA: NAD(P)H-hydrate epimerase, partial [Sediminibacterium sp.]|nr:NAD(P)H-hydrate epimerase [Sediminibacterium sp.]
MSFPAVLTSLQLREADAITLVQQQITAWELMERAATACAAWIRHNYTPALPVTVFCGPGNNGGDGLAIARILHNNGYPVQVYILASGKKNTDCLLENKKRWESIHSSQTDYLHSEEDLQKL